MLLEFVEHFKRTYTLAITAVGLLLSQDSRHTDTAGFRRDVKR